MRLLKALFLLVPLTIGSAAIAQTPSTRCRRA